MGMLRSAAPELDVSAHGRDWGVSLLLFLVASLIVTLEQVLSEVAVEVAPDRVNVISVVLCVVEFDKKVRCLHAIIMRITVADAARPGEMDIAARLVDLCDATRGQLAGHVACVFVQKA